MVDTLKPAFTRLSQLARIIFRSAGESISAQETPCCTEGGASKFWDAPLLRIRPIVLCRAAFSGPAPGEGYLAPEADQPCVPSGYTSHRLANSYPLHYGIRPLITVTWDSCELETLICDELSFLTVTQTLSRQYSFYIRGAVSGTSALRNPH